MTEEESCSLNKKKGIRKKKKIENEKKPRKTVVTKQANI